MSSFVHVLCLQFPGTILPDVKGFLLPIFTHDTAGQYELLGAADIVRERRVMNEVLRNAGLRDFFFFLRISPMLFVHLKCRLYSRGGNIYVALSFMQYG